MNGTNTTSESILNQSKEKSYRLQADAAAEIALDELFGIADEMLATSRREVIDEDYVKGAILEIMSDNNISALANTPNLQMRALDYIIIFSVFDLEIEADIIINILRTAVDMDRSAVSIANQLQEHLSSQNTNNLAESFRAKLLEPVRFKDNAAIAETFNQVYEHWNYNNLVFAQGLSVQGRLLSGVSQPMNPAMVESMLKALRNAILEDKLWGSRDRLRRERFKVNELCEFLKKLKLGSGGSILKDTRLGEAVYTLAVKRAEFVYNEKFTAALAGWEFDDQKSLLDFLAFLESQGITDFDTKRLDQSSIDELLTVVNLENEETQVKFLEILCTQLFDREKIFTQEMFEKLTKFIEFLKSKGYFNQQMLANFIINNQERFQAVLNEHYFIGAITQDMVVSNMAYFFRDIAKSEGDLESLIIARRHEAFVIVENTLNTLFAKEPVTSDAIITVFKNEISNIGFNFSYSRYFPESIDSKIKSLYSESGNSADTTTNLNRLIDYFHNGVLDPDIYSLGKLESKRLRELTLKLILTIVYNMPNKGWFGFNHKGRIRYVLNKLNESNASAMALMQGPGEKRKRGQIPLEMGEPYPRLVAPFDQHNLIGDDGEFVGDLEEEQNYVKPKGFPQGG